MEKRRMLLIFAHPDDESFGMGGTIAKYVDDGVAVSLVCTTNGDVGTIPEDMRDQFDTISELRLNELDCAAEKLGFDQVYKFGMKDSGMMGAESNQNPECSWFIWENDPERLIRPITKIIRELQPQVVVTFNKFGGYGHPDHIAAHHATVEAFNRANDPDYNTDGLSPYKPQKLYFLNIPALYIRIGIWMMRLRGKDPRKMGVNEDIDLIQIRNNIEPNHVSIDIREYLDAWDEASACHASQGGGRSGFLPRWLRKILGAKQGFTRVYPAPAQDTIDEHDFFNGVT